MTTGGTFLQMDDEPRLWSRSVVTAERRSSLAPSRVSARLTAQDGASVVRGRSSHANVVETALTVRTCESSVGTLAPRWLTSPWSRPQRLTLRRDPISSTATVSGSRAMSMVNGGICPRERQRFRSAREPRFCLACSVNGASSQASFTTRPIAHASVPSSPFTPTFARSLRTGWLPERMCTLGSAIRTGTLLSAPHADPSERRVSDPKFWSTASSWKRRLGVRSFLARTYITRTVFATTTAPRTLNFGPSNNHPASAAPNRNTARHAPATRASIYTLA